MACGEAPKSSNIDAYYFTSYEDLDIHELMLKDEPRTKAYQDYINSNSVLFRDKIVVDIGAGTGILSMFAAKAGAKQVFAIEASGVSRLCEEIIAHNGFEDKITVIHGCAEDVTLPNGVKADILISEWMGFYLLHESMLNSVITARDKFLDVDGIMVPSSATLYLCPVSMNKLYDDKFRYWNKVFGFDFAPVVPHIKHKVLSSPQIEVITKDQCLADPEEVLHIDLKYVESEEICNVMNHSRFNLSKNGLLHGLACWFDVEFEGDKPCLLSTGPNSEPTHWKQTVVLLPDALLVNRGDELQCKFLLEQSAHHPRRYNISIEIPEDDDESEEDLETAADRIMSAMNDVT